MQRQQTQRLWATAQQPPRRRDGGARAHLRAARRRALSLSGGLAAAHSASIFHGSTPRARVFRSVDVGVVVFVVSASLGYFVDRRTPEQQAPESPS
ncbi:hypothetical protein JL722_9199 [Aureococcus anophagefferens]|nr:hypothetical protein JL722_9199 [Aureococcus anophagefferens]